VGEVRPTDELKATATDDLARKRHSVDRRVSAGDDLEMKRTSLASKIVTFFAVAASITACYVEARGPVECRTRFHRRHDVEVCRTHCGDEGCRTHCDEEERWSREHHCWAE
jgi:hypothetical protein